MLILFGRDRQPVAIEASTQRGERCAFTAHVEAYTARRIGPELRAAFERHLIECGPCQRAVHLGRIANRLNHHNRSVGMPCAAHTRRNS
jgi:putative zinc finger protein